MATTALLLVASLLLLPTTGEAAQETTIQRRLAEAAAAHPHGLPFESPLALSPAAYEFFHPSSARAQRAAEPGLVPRGQPRGANGVSSASVARADHEEGGVAPPAGRRPGGVRRGGAVRAGVVAGVFAGAAVVVLAALGLAYAVAHGGGGDAEAEAPGAAKSSA